MLWGMVWVPPVLVMWSTCTEAPVVSATWRISARAVALFLPGLVRRRVAGVEEHRHVVLGGHAWPCAMISSSVTQGVYSGSKSTPSQPAAKPSSTWADELGDLGR